MDINIKDIKYDYGKFKVNTNKLYTKLELDTFLNDRYTKEETYNKNELNSLITTPNVQYMAVTATEQTTDAVDVLPTTGAANTIYRVGNWDNSQFDASVYSEYAWNGSQYIYLSTKTQIGEVFDISAYHATGGVLTKYVNLAAALDSNNGGGVPQSLQRGGMSVKFVQIPDNKYVQWRYMGTAVTGNPNPFLDTANWQGVDDEPTAGSKNLVKSGGVAEIVYSAKIVPYDCTYTTNELNNKNTYNSVLRAKSVIITATSDSNWCGIAFEINNPVIDKILKVCATRTGGVYTGRFIRTRQYDSNNTIIDEHQYSASFEINFLSNCVKIEILLFSSWTLGQITPSGSVITFNDIDISYKSIKSTVNNLSTKDAGLALSANMGVQLNRRSIMQTDKDIIIDIDNNTMIIPSGTNIRYTPWNTVYALNSATTISMVANAKTQLILFNSSTKVFSCVSWDTTISSLDAEISICNIIEIDRTAKKVTYCLYGFANILNSDYISSFSLANEKFDTIDKETQTGISVVENRGVLTSSYKNTIKRDNVLFVGDGISYEATEENKWQGVLIDVYNPIIGRRINIKATRVGGLGTNYIRTSWYDSNGNENDKVFHSGNTVSITIPNGAVRFVVLLAATWGSTFTVGSICTFNDVSLQYDNEDVDILLGVGNRQYIGVSKLNIGFTDFKMQENLLFTYKQSESPSQSINYTKAQSMEIWNNYIFCFLNGANAIILNRTTGEYVATMDIPFNCHNNSAQFTDTYLNAGDDYPLLILSRCDGTGYVSVIHIEENNGNFTCTLIKNIEISISQVKSYGYSACIDFNRKKLIVSWNLNGDWHVQSNNPVVIKEFELPDITDTQTVAFTIADAKDIAINPMYVVQGITYHNGLIYSAAQLRDSYWQDKFGIDYTDATIVFDPNSGELLNIIPMGGGEPEGICIKNDKLYLQSRNNAATGNNIAMWIYEYVF